MQDFDTSDVQDDDGIEITDLDPQSESSSTSPSLVLLRFARKIPFLANTRAKSTALSLLMCGVVLLFLVQPGLPSVPSHASNTPVLTTSCSVTDQSPSSIVFVSSVKVTTWVKVSVSLDEVCQARDGIEFCQFCK